MVSNAIKSNLNNNIIIDKVRICIIYAIDFSRFCFEHFKIGFLTALMI